MSEPFPFDPERREPRGHFPRHSDRPRRVLTAEEAAERARRRLEDWRAEHG